jgi:hypothetical protein
MVTVVNVCLVKQVDAVSDSVSYLFTVVTLSKKFTNALAATMQPRCCGAFLLGLAGAAVLLVALYLLVLWGADRMGLGLNS